MVKVKDGKRKGGEGKNVQAMQFNHALGQHILKNPLIVQALVDKVKFIVNNFILNKILGFIIFKK